MNDNVPGSMLPIRLSVRLADDDGAPWPAATHVVFADDAGRDHRLTIAPGATDVELGAALRQIVAYELAARDADLAGKSPDERRGDFRVVDDQ